MDPLNAPLSRDATQDAAPVSRSQGAFRFAPRLIGAVLAAALVATPAVAQTPTGIAAHANVVRGDEINSAQQQAVEKGLQWLADHQAADGSFGGPGGAHAAITALAGLSFMEAGNLPGRGKYGASVTRCLHYILDCCQESGRAVALRG